MRQMASGAKKTYFSMCCFLPTFGTKLQIGEGTSGLISSPQIGKELHAPAHQWHVFGDRTGRNLCMFLCSYSSFSRKLESCEHAYFSANSWIFLGVSWQGSELCSGSCFLEFLGSFHLSITSCAIKPQRTNHEILNIQSYTIILCI